MSFVPLADQVVCFYKTWSTFRDLLWCWLSKRFILGHPRMFEKIFLTSFFLFFFVLYSLAVFIYIPEILDFCICSKTETVLKSFAFICFAGFSWINALISNVKSYLIISCIYIYIYTDLDKHICVYTVYKGNFLS